MDMQFRSPDPEGALWHQRSLARMRRALRRLHGAVAQVRVQLEDINGPDGGVDKRCRVEVAVPGQEPVANSTTAASPPRPGRPARATRAPLRLQPAG